MNYEYILTGIFLFLAISLFFLFFRKPNIVVKKPKLGIRSARIIYTDQYETNKDPDVEY
ncbi:MAG: hypothetical protein GX327_04675, partial [Epulopiscium sp.]|nr:hypothetical protein [Candidatus Epulonipiscium sp.]